MKARIIAKNHIVSKVYTKYLCNGRVIDTTEVIVNKKPAKACTGRADRVVFRAIHTVGHEWDKVSNHIDKHCTSDIADSLSKQISRHTI